MESEITLQLEDGKKLVWEIHKCSADEWINSTLNDEGLYLDITELVNSHYSWVVQGNNNTLFCVDVDIHGKLNYYLGYLE